MPINYDPNDIKRIQLKFEKFFADFDADLKMVGEAGAEAIVQATLAGIGENDAPFKEYSAAYKETIEAVGGKPQETVNLRGLFYHAGQRRSRMKDKNRAAAGEGRQAYLQRRFQTKRGEAAFTAKTGMTRPQRGLTDKLSEMSLDLIEVTAVNGVVRVIYKPRKDDYMQYHQNGSGRIPQRKWFTANRASVKAAMTGLLGKLLQARISWFNRGGQT